MQGIDGKAQMILALAVLLIVAAVVISTVSDDDWAKITAFILAALA